MANVSNAPIASISLTANTLQSDVFFNHKTGKAMDMDDVVSDLDAAQVFAVADAHDMMEDM
jgi:hypothetical protein